MKVLDRPFLAGLIEEYTGTQSMPSITIPPGNTRDIFRTRQTSPLGHIFWSHFLVRFSATGQFHWSNPRRYYKLIQQPAMGYGDLSHTKVIISHEAKLSGIYETKVWDKFNIPLLVIGLVFYSTESQFQAK